MAAFWVPFKFYVTQGLEIQILMPSITKRSTLRAEALQSSFRCKNAFFCCCCFASMEMDAMLVSETLVVVFSCRECVNSLFEELINI